MKVETSGQKQTNISDALSRGIMKFRLKESIVIVKSRGGRGGEEKRKKTFIKGYSSMSRPLELLTGKYAKFVWNADHQEAFEQLRARLLEAPVLGLADMNKTFRR